MNQLARATFYHQEHCGFELTALTYFVLKKHPLWTLPLRSVEKRVANLLRLAKEKGAWKAYATYQVMRSSIRTFTPDSSNYAWKRDKTLLLLSIWKGSQLNFEHLYSSDIKSEKKLQPLVSVRHNEVKYQGVRRKSLLTKLLKLQYLYISSLRVLMIW